MEPGGLSGEGGRVSSERGPRRDRAFGAEQLEAASLLRIHNDSRARRFRLRSFHGSHGSVRVKRPQTRALLLAGSIAVAAVGSLGPASIAVAATRVRLEVTPA